MKRAGAPLDEDDVSAPSEEELQNVCEGLLRSWAETYSGDRSIELGSKDQAPDAVRFTIVLAFVAHAHHVTTVAADLMRAGEYPSAIPLLRIGYECALTATWAAQSEESSRALHNQYLETARKLHGSATRTGWFEDLLIEPHSDDLLDVAPSAKGEAAYFVNLCLALEPHGEWLYTMYRLLSAHSHPSGTILSLYAPGEVGEAISLSPNQPEDGQAWWHAAATNLLHAGQALDRLDPSGSRCEALVEAGKLIGWLEPLRLTGAAASKLAAARARRAAALEAPDDARRDEL